MKMSGLLLVLVCLLTQACGSADGVGAAATNVASTVTGYTLNGVNDPQCPAVKYPELFTVVQSGTCPTAAGLWDLYLIIFNSAGVATVKNQYCSGGINSFPASQGVFNQYFVGPQDVSGNDYHASTVCESATKTMPDGTKNLYVFMKR
jgi:hypothetical protein